jgi:hypothetical protein
MIQKPNKNLLPGLDLIILGAVFILGISFAGILLPFARTTTTTEGQTNTSVPYLDNSSDKTLQIKNIKFNSTAQTPPGESETCEGGTVISATTTTKQSNTPSYTTTTTTTKELIVCWECTSLGCTANYIENAEDCHTTCDPNVCKATETTTTTTPPYYPPATTVTTKPPTSFLLKDYGTKKYNC